MGDSSPTFNEHGDEVHPAFGMISAHRVTVTPGAVLFDSDIRHGHYVTVSISTATRQRDLKQDWLHSDREIIEVAMSEAQWASFVSSMNTTGVPCTLRRRETDRNIDGLTYEPRLAVTMNETRQAAEEMFAEALAAMERYEQALATGGAKEKREALRNLKATLANSAPNVAFAGKQLAEQAENIVQRARGDIEAMVTQKAAQLGIGGSSALELDAGFGTQRAIPEDSP